ncbi:MAG: LysM peptidoglycan-binding domain-containing protein, partial [Phaeodactylibacter sp.]|nr:LysM peptidoglycan-binding domain-containing protein [Phaeodactylibacter sp.]
PSQGREYSPQGDFYSITGNRIETGATSSDNSGLTSKGLISGSFSSRSPAGAGTAQDYGAARTNAPSRENTARSFYVVQEGDTLYRIARMYGMTVERIREINNLGAKEVIIPYQKIYLN